MISEAFKSIISRNFTPDQAQEISILAAQQPTEDPAVFREEGVSFNPRPARFFDIAKRVNLPLTYDLAKSLLNISAECSFINFDALKNHPAELQAIWLIDTVRHLHFTQLDAASSKEILDLAKKAIKSPSPLATPIADMLQHALKRYA